MSNDEHKGTLVGEGEKPLVFISHNNEDVDIANAFSDLLVKSSRKVVKTFYSSDTTGRSGIKVCENWYETVMENLKKASDVVCLVTRRSLNRPWILYEAGIATGLPEIGFCGVGFGIPKGDVSNGPFAQVQNYDDNVESLINLVRQLIEKNTPQKLTDEELRPHVEEFKANIKPVLEEINGALLQKEESMKLDNGYLYLIDDLVPRIKKRLDGGVTGTLQIFNIELNRLEPLPDNEKFWEFLKEHSVGNITIAIPPERFRKLEKHLRSTGPFAVKVVNMLNDIDIIPVEIGPVHTNLAFALFTSKETPPSIRSYTFPKMEYFSKFNSDDEDNHHWEYEFFVESDNVRINQKYKDLFDISAKPFHVEDIQELALGEPQELDAVIRKHQLGESYQKRGKTLITDCYKNNYETPISELRCKRKESNKSDVFIFEGVGGDWSLEAINPESQKPVLLCISPLSLSDWPSSMRGFDNKLINDYSVLHLKLSTKLEEMTFSLLLCSIREAVCEIGRGIDGLIENQKDIALLGVGLPAYILLESAQLLVNDRDNKLNINLLAVCLLAPEIDILTAIDSFSGKNEAKFSNYLFLASDKKFPEYTAGFLMGDKGGLGSILGTQMEFYFLLDMMCRGKKRCGREYFSGNLKDVVGAEIPIFIGYSPPLMSIRDNNVLDILASSEFAKKVDKHEIPWVVDIKPASGELMFSPNVSEGSGLSFAIDFLRKIVGSNGINSVKPSSEESSSSGESNGRSLERGKPEGPYTKSGMGFVHAFDSEQSKFPVRLKLGCYTAELCLSDDEKGDCRDFSWFQSERFCEVEHGEEVLCHKEGKVVPDYLKDVTRCQYLRVCEPGTSNLIGVYRLDLINPDNDQLPSDIKKNCIVLAKEKLASKDNLACVSAFLKKGLRDNKEVFNALFSCTYICCHIFGIKGLYIQVQEKVHNNFKKLGFIEVGESFKGLKHRWYAMLMKPLDVMGNYSRQEFQKEMYEKNGCELDTDFWAMVDEAVTACLGYMKKPTDDKIDSVFKSIIGTKVSK
ncbi:MAG: hypothetical protein GY928_38150 [Colwellia sp.]|nr:hypothetical protein [Colwellia sp.]